MSVFDNINVRCWAKFELVQNGSKCPKYRMTMLAGAYEPLTKITGKRGDGKDKVELTLLNAIDDSNSNAPGTRFQAARSLNFTGLKQYWQDGKPSGYAWGNPPLGETYGTKKRLPNPFHPDYVGDGFLFNFHGNVVIEATKMEVPEWFELVVLPHGKNLASSYLTVWRKGGWNDLLDGIRKAAVKV